MFNGFVPFLKYEHLRITMITALFFTEIRRHSTLQVQLLKTNHFQFTKMKCWNTIRSFELLNAIEQKRLFQML